MRNIDVIEKLAVLDNSSFPSADENEILNFITEVCEKAELPIIRRVFGHIGLGVGIVASTELYLLGYEFGLRLTQSLNNDIISESISVTCALISGPSNGALCILSTKYGFQEILKLFQKETISVRQKILKLFQRSLIASNAVITSLAMTGLSINSMRNFPLPILLPILFCTGIGNYCIFYI